MLFQKDVMKFNPAWQAAAPVQLGEEMAQLK
jgi:phosphatidylserine decarboxylase